MRRKHYIYSGNRMHSHVEEIRTYCLVLKSNFILDVNRIFSIMSFSKNLVSISKILSYVFSLNFIGTSFHLFKDNVNVGDVILDDVLFKFHLNSNCDYNILTVHGDIGIKHSVINEKSSM